MSKHEIHFIQRDGGAIRFLNFIPRVGDFITICDEEPNQDICLVDGIVTQAHYWDINDPGFDQDNHWHIYVEAEEGEELIVINEGKSLQDEEES